MARRKSHLPRGRRGPKKSAPKYQTVAYAPTQPKNPQTPSRLFDLPPELRNTIYELAFTPSTFSRTNTPALFVVESQPPPTSLLAACQRLHDETIGLHQAAKQTYRHHRRELELTIDLTLSGPARRSPFGNLPQNLTKLTVTWRNGRNHGWIYPKLTTTTTSLAPAAGAAASAAPPPRRWSAYVKLHDDVGRGEASMRARFTQYAERTMEAFHGNPDKDRVGENGSPPGFRWFMQGISNWGWDVQQS